ncbi:MAG: FAD:protein FMN transferase [Actinomycetota bacterium]|nr:FAD:protein FMN transferase [Actinomycetota bacterium]
MTATLQGDAVTALELEVGERFACFGAHAAVYVIGSSLDCTAAQAVSEAQRRLLHWNHRLSRFVADSELCRLNADPRERVPVSAVMAQFVDAALRAAAQTGGLVDATLLAEIEQAGYRSDHRVSLPLDMALTLAPRRQPAQANPAMRWRAVRVDRGGRTVSRPPGCKLDTGGIAKGLCADILGETLRGHASYAVDCAGDVRIGGRETMPRTVRVASPFGEEILHEYELLDGGVATSGIAKRSWLDADGRPAHHILDPATGRPAFTGIVQVTALAPTALEAETLAKAALLAGPEDADRWLAHGGVVVFDDGSYEVKAAGPAMLTG